MKQTKKKEREKNNLLNIIARETLSLIYNHNENINNNVTDFGTLIQSQQNNSYVRKSHRKQNNYKYKYRHDTPQSSPTKQFSLCSFNFYIFG